MSSVLRKTVGRLAEVPLERGAVQLDLRPELLRIAQRAEAVMEGLAEELDAAGGHQLLEALERVRGVGLELVEQHAAQAHRDPEPRRPTGGSPR